MLFLDKVFLKPAKSNLRGVELFNLSLIRDLLLAGIKVLIPVHYSWKGEFLRQMGVAGPDFYEARGRSSFFNGLRAIWSLYRPGRSGPQRIILANVANGLIPALCLLRLFRPRLEVILFAHRMPSKRFMFVLPRKRTRVLAVNHIIASCFKRSGFADAEVFFGHTNADRFHPGGPGGAANESKKVNFCVVGFLDNAWKGADTVIAAFRAMPPEISADCALHLASYRSPPALPEKNIIVYDWFPVAEMPDWLRRMDVMIVPSRDERVMRETFSLAMVEGMLTALPLIASNLPILREKLETGGGYVFNNVEELAGLMTRLASNPELRGELGARARAIALERYVWDTKLFISRYIQV